MRRLTARVRRKASGEIDPLRQGRMGAEPEVQQRRRIGVAQIALGKSDHEPGRCIVESGDSESVNVRALFHGA